MKSKRGSQLCLNCSTFENPVHATEDLQKGECPQAYGFYITFPGHPAQYFIHKFWEQLPYNIDKQLNYLFQRIKKIIIQMVLKEDWVRKAGLCPGFVFKWLFNCIILLAYMHIAMSIF